MKINKMEAVKILNVNKTASINGYSGEETVNNKTQTQGKSFLFLVLSKNGV